ncbi:unnamed protein product [Calicophoron daubneyi]|uniref:Uncharacterized protein n=1 Tax=Calicophoron daubneyi TaxID=300641 RepID=A0AAV2TCR1_CALDB
MRGGYNSVCEAVGHATHIFSSFQYIMTCTRLLLRIPNSRPKNLLMRLRTLRVGLMGISSTSSSIKLRGTFSRFLATSHTSFSSSLPSFCCARQNPNSEDKIIVAIIQTRRILLHTVCT